MPTVFWLGTQPKHEQILDLPNDIRKDLVINYHLDTSPFDYIVFAGDVPPLLVATLARKYPNMPVLVPETDHEGHLRWHKL